MSYDDPLKREPYFVAATTAEGKRFFAPAFLRDYDAYGKLFRADLPGRQSGWFAEADIYADKKGTPVSFDPAFHEAEAIKQADLIAMLQAQEATP